MGCGIVKCTEQTCTKKLPACQMIQGRCPACNATKNQPKIPSNVFNQSTINGQQSKQ
jgi:hypothetical protein